MLKTKLKPQIGWKSLILIAVCGLLIALDLVTKHLEELYNWDNIKIIPGFIEICGNIRNPGCAFSFLNENPEIGQPILITLTFIMLAFLALAFVFVPERFVLIKISISMVVAGAIGNLADRLMFREVRDFIGLNMLFDKSHLVYCNVADFCIVIGAVIVIIDLLFLNEWAVFPLTKSAKAAQAKLKEKQAEADKISEPVDEQSEHSEPQQEDQGGVNDEN